MTSSEKYDTTEPTTGDDDGYVDGGIEMELQEAIKQKKDDEKDDSTMEKAEEEEESRMDDVEKGGALTNTSNKVDMTEEPSSILLDDETANDPSRTQTKKEKKWHQHPRIVELYTQADWWTLWIGLASFALAVGVVFVVPLSTDTVRYVVPQPKSWTTNPLDAWNMYNLVGIPLLLYALSLFYLISLWAMGKLQKTVVDEDESSSTFYPYGHMVVYIQGYVTMAFIATIALWLGSNQWCSENMNHWQIV